MQITGKVFFEKPNFDIIMNIKFFAPKWGSENISWKDFFPKVKNAGYDGVDRINYERRNTKTECSTTICTCTMCVALKQKYTK